METAYLDRVWDRLSGQKITPLVTFLIGGATVGAISSVYPLLVWWAALLLAGAVAGFYFSGPEVRLAAIVLWLLLMSLLWIVFFHPKIIDGNIQKAEQAIATNASECVDFGRIQALEDLASYGHQFHQLEIDCANVDGIRFPRGTFLGNMSLVNGRAEKAVFVGTEMWGAILAGSDFQSADFSDASLGGAIFGMHFLSDRKSMEGHCYQGANVSGAKFDNADLDRAWLIGIKGMTCPQVMKAKNWSTAVRDEKLACGATIPHPSDLPQYDYVKEWWPQKCGMRGQQELPQP
jgi:hypothetical protein